MKISFLNCSLGAWLTKRQVAWCIVSLVYLLVGSYLVGRHFGLVVIVLLGIATILIAGAARAFLKWNKVDREQSGPAKEDLQQITLGWDYRPKGSFLGHTVVANTGAKAAEALSATPPTPNENDNVWFNFKNPEPTLEQAPTTAPLSGDARKVSRYD
jgi:hypothetical protein